MSDFDCARGYRKPVRTPNLSKTIGLIRWLDGNYRPSNDRSKEKLNRMFRESSSGLFASGPDVIHAGQLSELRKLAAEAGYKIMTSIKGVL